MYRARGRKSCHRCDPRTGASQSSPSRCGYVVGFATLRKEECNRRRVTPRIARSILTIEEALPRIEQGFLARFNANHWYGMACYRLGGCADIVQAVADPIGARQFNPSFSQTFSRVVQPPIWGYLSPPDLHV